MKAFQIDLEDRSTVFFQPSAALARVAAADEIGCEPDEVDLIRASHFDEFSPGPVPMQALIENGWWCECIGCGKRVDKDVAEYNSEEIKPFYEVDHVYCNIWCMINKREEEQKQLIKENYWKRRFLKSYPDAKILTVHAYKGVAVRFEYPGITGILKFQTEDEKDGIGNIFMSRESREQWIKLFPERE